MMKKVKETFELIKSHLSLYCLTSYLQQKKMHKFPDISKLFTISTHPDGLLHFFSITNSVSFK